MNEHLIPWKSIKSFRFTEDEKAIELVAFSMNPIRVSPSHVEKPEELEVLYKRMARFYGAWVDMKNLL